jgi:hypothetical protein
LVVVVAANVAEHVSFGYGKNVPQGIVGTRLRKNVVLTFTIIADQGLYILKLRNLHPLYLSDPYLI